MATKAKIKTEKTLVKKTRAIPNKIMAAKIDNFFEKKEEVIETVSSASPIVAAQAELVITEAEKPKFKILDKKIILRILFGLLIAGLMGFSGYFYYQYKKVTSANAAKDEIATYVEKINKFMILPADEQPTMATVADKEKLASQAFFAKAENGDKVFFYSKSQKAILYRPSSNMIIEATSMAGGAASADIAANIPAAEDKAPAPAQQVVEQPAPSESSTEIKKEVRVFVENGTAIKGLAKILSEKIASISGVSVAGTGNTVGNYDKTVVVDLSGENGEVAAEIAKALGGEVGQLPADETRPDAEILVIGGKL